MPRTGRLILPGFPHHIVQRGHNKQVIFAEDGDYRYYLDTLAEYKQEYQVKVHAYCLMTNHVHLLLEPETAAGLGGLMKRLAGRQTRYFNRQEARRGTLWEGRYKSSIVDMENYFFACLRYIELNPVRAGMVMSPADYPWSSYISHYEGNMKRRRANKYVDNVNLKGINGGEYDAYISAPINKDETVLVREAVNRNQLTGNARFVDEIESITGR